MIIVRERLMKAFLDRSC